MINDISHHVVIELFKFSENFEDGLIHKVF